MHANGARLSHVNGCISAQDHKVKALLTSKGLRRVMTLRTRHDIWNAAFVNERISITIQP